MKKPPARPEERFPSFIGFFFSLVSLLGYILPFFTNGTRSRSLFQMIKTLAPAADWGVLVCLVLSLVCCVLGFQWISAGINGTLFVLAIIMDVGVAILTEPDFLQMLPYTDIGFWSYFIGLLGTAFSKAFAPLDRRIFRRLFYFV